KSPYLMFTNRHEIRRIDLLKSEYTQVVPTLKNAVALDVDVSTNKMFWCDLYHRKIYSSHLAGDRHTLDRLPGYYRAAPKHTRQTAMHHKLRPNLGHGKNMHAPCRRTPGWDLNPGPLCCKATVPTSALYLWIYVFICLAACFKKYL
ncbi:hypothetical protein AMECASPLE_020816, partial [Ameca splendens]